MVKPTQAPPNRNFVVSKANSLITSRYDLSLQEQRLILTLVSLVDTIEDKQFYEYEMKLSEFAELLEVKVDISYLKKMTLGLLSKTIQIKEEDKTIQTQWLSSVVYNEGQATVKFELHRKLLPYLLQLKKRFTSYYLMNVLKFKSKYSIRIFELLKCNEFKASFTINLEELKIMLACENYTRFSNFNQKVLQPALEEINIHSDIFVNCVPIKTGRSITQLRFDIIKRNKLLNEFYANAAAELRLKEKYK